MHLIFHFVIAFSLLNIFYKYNTILIAFEFQNGIFFFINLFALFFCDRMSASVHCCYFFLWSDIVHIYTSNNEIYSRNLTLWTQVFQSFKVLHCFNIDLKLLSEIYQQDKFAFDVHCEISNKYQFHSWISLFFNIEEHVYQHIWNHLY